MTSAEVINDATEEVIVVSVRRVGRLRRFLRKRHVLYAAAGVIVLDSLCAPPWLFWVFDHIAPGW